VAGRFSKRHKRYIREDDNKSNNKLIDKASSEQICARYSPKITGTDRRARLDASFNTRYAVKYYVFANFIALCRAITFTNPII
jgi:hypothetical protein